jgi:hypothetical protein
VLRWSQADEFWRSNILSMPKFREKFGQLAMRMRTERAAGGASGNELNAALSRAFRPNGGAA